MTTCVLCGEQIKKSELTDRTAEVHLECSIKEVDGCVDEMGMFTHCWECWKPCSFRQCLPEEVRV